MADPRVYFAAERTLLAWMRTGLTVMALGFVVARFGLFMQLMARPGAPSPLPEEEPLASAVLGVLLILCGTAAILAAALQHRRYVLTLPPGDVPPAYRRSWSVPAALVLATLGVLLAVYVSL